MDIENKSIEELLALTLDDINNMTSKELYELRDRLSKLKGFDVIYNLGYSIGLWENATC